MEKPHGSHHEARPEQGERKEDFREVVVSKQAEQWADSHDGPGRAKLEEAVDALAERLARDPDLHPRLSKYRLFVHSGDAVFVAKSGDALEVSASDLMKNGSAATAGFLIKELRKQEQLPEAASVDESADEELPQGTFRSPEAEPQPEAVEKEDGEPVGDEEPLPERSAEGGVEPEDVDAVPAKESAAKSEKEQEETVQQPEREDLEEDVFPERPAEGGVEPEGGVEEERKPESIADGELPPGTFDDRVAEKEPGAASESEPVGSDAQKESPRPRPRQERSFDHLFGEDRPDWKRNVREAASRIVERFVPKDTIDWAKIAYASELEDWHAGRAVRLKEKWSAQQDTIHDLEAGSRYLADQEKKFREQGEVGAATLLRIERERADQEAKLTKAQNAADRTQSSLEHRNEQRQRFLSKRNEICRNFQVRVEERIRPFEERLSDLKLTRERLANEIVQDKAFVISRQAEAAATLKKIAEEKFPAVRRAHRERMAPVLRDIASFSREIAEREKDKARIDKGIMKQNKKLRPFEDRHEKLARIMRDQGVDTGVPERDRTRHHVAEVLQTEGSDRGAGTPESGAAEAQKTYSGEDLVEAWNNANGSRMLIHPETAKENFPTFFASGASVDDFWRFAEFYAERYGDEDQLSGMPSMERAVRRRKGFWKKLFGRSNRQKNQGRFKEYLKKLK